MIEIHLIGGEMDGCILEREHLFDSITFPTNPHFGYGYYGEWRILYDKIVYRRVPNTENYICVEEGE